MNIKKRKNSLMIQILEYKSFSNKIYYKLVTIQIKMKSLISMLYEYI